MADQQPTEPGHAQQQETDEDIEVMAGRQPPESGQDQQRETDEDLQVVELGRGETSGDNQLQPFVGNWKLEELEKVVKGSRGNIIKFEMHQHQTTQRTTNVTGDIVRGEKLDVKHVKSIEKIKVGSDPTPQPQEPPKTSYLRGHTDTEDSDEVYTSDEQPTRSRKTLSEVRKRSYNAPGGAKQKPTIYKSYEEPSTSSRQSRKILPQSRKRTNDETGGIKQKWKKASSKSATTQKRIPDVEYDLLKEFREFSMGSPEDQTTRDIMEMYYDEGRVPEDQTTRDIMEMYYDEDTEQDIGDLEPILRTIWISIQLNLVWKSFQRLLAIGSKFPPTLQSVFTNLISQYNEANNGEQQSYKFKSRIDDVFNLGKQFRSENNFIHAVISFCTAAKLHKQGNKGDRSVFGVGQCVRQLTIVVEIMTKQLNVTKVVLDIIFPLLFEIKEMLVTIKNTTHEFLVEREAWCLFNIGICYDDCSEYEQFVNMNESAIELMRRHFKDEAEKYMVYGFCLNNVGAGLGRMGKTEEAGKYYEMALKAYEKATDWMNDENKNEEIALTESNLKRVKERLRK